MTPFLIVKHFYKINNRKCTKKLMTYVNKEGKHDEHFDAYIEKHGYHFTDELAVYASKNLSNVDGETRHHWEPHHVQEKLNVNTWLLPDNVTLGDVTYLANMYYSDFFPQILATEILCIKAAHKMAFDPDGYEGMIFCRWLTDVAGRQLDIPWERFV